MSTLVRTINAIKAGLRIIVLLITVVGIYNSVDARTGAVEDGLISYWSIDKETVNGNKVENIHKW